MKKWHLVIDIDKCEDCNNCFLACKDEHVDNEWPGYSAPQPRHGQRWINILRKERGRYPHIDVAYRPTPCMHCDDAPCMAASRNGAVSKRPDGIVLIDPEKAAGQKELVQSCPYGAIWYNEERQLPQKCTMCAHLLDEGWSQPRCVQACPTGALRALYLADEEMAGVVRVQKLEILHPQWATRPRIYYRNLSRFSHCFIAGSVTIEKNSRVDCAEGAIVTLKKENAEVERTLTDPFGDFKFENLEENSGVYMLEVDYPGAGAKLLPVDLRTSISLNTIHLK